MEISFVNNGEDFELPLINVTDIRALQKKRAITKDADSKELESSIALVFSILKRVDGTVKETDIVDWEYAAFLEFVQKLWEKNAENFRGTLPKLAAQK